MIVLIIEFFKPFLKIDSKIDEIVFFHFKITKFVDDDQTTIRIIVHFDKIVDDILCDQIKISNIRTKFKFQTTKCLFFNQILYVFDFDIFDREKINVSFQFVFNFQNSIIDVRLVFFDEFV